MAVEDTSVPSEFSWQYHRDRPHARFAAKTSCFLPRVGEFSRLKIQFAVAFRAQARRRVQLWLAELPGVIS